MEKDEDGFFPPNPNCEACDGTGLMPIYEVDLDGNERYVGEDTCVCRVTGQAWYADGWRDEE